MIIVQIGTNTASWEENSQIKQDSCLSFVKNNLKSINFIHLIEPLSSCNKSILNSYNFIENKKIHNIAISPYENDENMLIYFPKNQLTSGHSSSKINHLNVHGHFDLSSVTVESVSLNKFFDREKIYNCDKLFIDTEGLDCLILMSLDLNKYNIKYIEFEAIHSDNPFTKGVIYENCIKKLKDHGYFVKSSLYDSLNIVAEKI